MKNERNVGIKLLNILLLIFSIALILLAIRYFHASYIDMKYRKDVDKEKENFSVDINKIKENIGTNEESDISNDKINEYIVKYNNKDIVAFINIDNTNISYPIVRTKDNEYYLKHGYDLEYNPLGAIFMDYRNNIDFSSINTILYGHRVKTGQMFQDLIKFLDHGFALNNRTIELYTRNGLEKYKIVSIFKEDKNYNYIITDFIDLSEFIEYKNSLKDKSMYKFEDVTKEEVYTPKTSKIVTLSTCSYDFEGQRLVVIAEKE